MITRNKFYRQTGKKVRTLATSQIVSKNGYRVEIPAKCYTRHGLIKASVLPHIIGKWNQERVQYLVDRYGAVILERTEEKGA